MEIKFLRVRDVKEPVRDVNENAGIDLYIPKKTKELDDEIKSFNENIEIYDDHMVIPPHEDICIPAGIKSTFDPRLALVAANKSGVATKKKLIFGAQVIDSGYQGEWHIHLINWSNHPQTIEYDTKIVQFLPQMISTDVHIVMTCSEEEFFTEKTNRGEGGFGSTGIN